ncbi:MAG: hypothetical protein Q4D21_04005 [Phascolarctobacterium sp.]|nr:hypothetical protein [Phascolarctobacterium sp.]
MAPSVLALKLDEAISRLEAAGYTCETKSLLPPRDSDDKFAGFHPRKYVVRQQELSNKIVLLTFVYRI